MQATWWMKILLGVGGIALLIWLTEIENWILLFWWPIVITLMAFSSLGLISDGLYEATANFVPRLMHDIKERVNVHLEQKRVASPAGG